MKQYRIVTNGRTYKVQEKTVLRWRSWTDTKETLRDARGETYDNLVQFDTKSKAIEWINRNSPEKWNVVYEEGSRRFES